MVAMAQRNNGDGNNNGKGEDNDNSKGNGNGNSNGATGGGTLDRASACPATHIRSYAKTFSKFVAIYNHLSHFHIFTFPQASACL